MQAGKGYNWSGKGYNWSGKGLNWSGKGLNWSGKGNIPRQVGGKGYPWPINVHSGKGVEKGEACCWAPNEGGKGATEHTSFPEQFKQTGGKGTQGGKGSIHSGKGLEKGNPKLGGKGNQKLGGKGSKKLGGKGDVEEEVTNADLVYEKIEECFRKHGPAEVQKIVDKWTDFKGLDFIDEMKVEVLEHMMDELNKLNGEEVDRKMQRDGVIEDWEKRGAAGAAGQMDDEIMATVDRLIQLYEFRLALSFM